MHVLRTTFRPICKIHQQVLAALSDIFEGHHFHIHVLNTPQWHNAVQ